MVGLWQVPHKIHYPKIQPKNCKKRREIISELNQKIEKLQSAPDLTPRAKEIPQEQNNILNEHLKNKAQGALVRSRFKHLNETNSSTSYFFNLEKNNSISKSISKIRLPSGTITEDPT